MLPYLKNHIFLSCVIGGVAYGLGREFAPLPLYLIPSDLFIVGGVAYVIKEWFQNGLTSTKDWQYPMRATSGLVVAGRALFHSGAICC